MSKISKTKGKKNYWLWISCKSYYSIKFFWISNEIDFIIEDNNLKHGKYIPGVKIPIFNKSKIQDKNNTILVLAWNFFNEIKSKQGLILQKIL